MHATAKSASPGETDDFSETDDFFEMNNQPHQNKLHQPMTLAQSLLKNGSLITGGVSAAAIAAAAAIPNLPDLPASEGSEVPKDLVTISISGSHFVVSLETLERFPETLLGNPSKRIAYWNAATDEYFFERHRPSFDAILYYYQSDGYLKRPTNVPMQIFEREVRFFGIMAQGGPADGGGDAPLAELHNNATARFSIISANSGIQAAIWKTIERYKRKIWLLIEYPDTSKPARVIATFSIFVIFLSTTSFCLETIPELQEAYRSKCTALQAASNSSKVLENLMQTNDSTSEFTTTARPHVDIVLCSSWDEPFYVIESLCIIWFTFEFIVRFATCPSRCVFAKSFLNWVDFVAIVPFYINIVLTDGANNTSFAVLRVLRLVRVFRIFKLSRHSRGLQVLGKTLSASIQELALLIFFLVMALVLSGSAIYFAEAGEPNTGFTSIPASFWFAIVTLTTVGYGDITPVQTNLYQFLKS